MERFDAEGYIVAGIVGYAIARAIFEDLDGPDRRRIAAQALTYIPRPPEMLTDRRIWNAVQTELRTLGGLPATP